MIKVSRTAIELFGLSIHWYGILIGLGIFLATLLACAREERMGLPKDTALDVVLLALPLSILGARLYYVIFSWDEYASGPWWKVFAVWEGGLAIYGGILTALLVGWIFARVRKISIAALLDLVAPCFPLGQAIGRWGNFLNQEAHGGLVSCEALQFFPVSVEIGGHWYYATFFYESAWCFLIAALILWGEKKNAFRRRGDGFMTYVFLYALERAVVEGLRTDSLYWGGIRVSQALSLILALAMAVTWALRCRKAPIALCAAGPACLLIALGCAWMNFGWGTFAAAAASLVAVSIMYKREYSGTKIENRGENS